MNIYIEVEGSLGQAIQGALSVVEMKQSFTEFANSKLVIIDTTEALARLYTPKKYFVLFSWENPGFLPKNAEWHDIPRLKLLLSYLAEETVIDQKINCQKICPAETYRSIALLYFKNFVGVRLSSFDVWMKNTREVLIWGRQTIRLHMLIKIVKHIIEHGEEIECGEPESELARQINKLQSEHKSAGAKCSR